MNAWNQHWFGPVAAIRPYLFQKCFVLLVAFDALVLMLERGGRYGLDEIPFNVPHFAWLQRFHDFILPLGIPTATYYVALLVTTSFVALVLVFAGHRPWLMLVLTVLYTYLWSMSRLDSYLHHYMLSLIMACMVFFPAIDGRALRARVLTPTSPAKRAKPTTPPLAICATVLFVIALAYRFSLSQTLGLTPWQRWISMFVFSAAAAGIALLVSRRLPATGMLVESWAFRLLGTTVGVIYVFTSIAKMDSEWCGGHTLLEVGTTAEVLRPIEDIATNLGISADLFWAGLASFVIPLELTLAVSYLVAVRQDEPERVWLRRWCIVAWLLAIGLHLNNEMMNLIIQWFGYYMLLLATLILLPSRYLTVLGALFYWPESWARDRYDSWIEQLPSGRATVLLGLISVFALFVLILCGLHIWIAGAQVATCILAAGLVMTLIVGMVLGWERRSIGVSLVAGLAGLVMIAATTQSSMRFDYFDLRGKTLQQMGQHKQAIAEMNKALLFPPPSQDAVAEVLTNLGLSHRYLNQTADAEKHYLEAIQFSDRAFLAHYGLANMYVALNRFNEAEPHYRRALGIKPDFSDAYVNLGSMLEYTGRVEEAIKAYRQALVFEPNAPDVLQLLAAAKLRMKEPPAEE